MEPPPRGLLLSKVAELSSEPACQKDPAREAVLYLSLHLHLFISFFFAGPFTFHSLRISLLVRLPYWVWVRSDVDPRLFKMYNIKFGPLFVASPEFIPRITEHKFNCTFIFEFWFMRRCLTYQTA